MKSFLSQLMVEKSSVFLKAGGLTAALLGFSLSGCVLTEYPSEDCTGGRMETGCADTPAQTCEASCASLREETYLSCIDAGNHGEDCQVEALDAYDSCMVGACGTGTDTTGTGDSTTDGAIEPAPETDPATGEGSDGGDAQPPADGSTGEATPAPYPGDPSSPDSDCSYYCETQASQFFEECMASGAPPEDCERKASSIWESCMGSCQPVEPEPVTPPPSTGGSSDCSESCQAFAQGVYTECMVSTGDPVTCEDHAQLAAQSCMYGCQVGSEVEPVPTEPPPPQDCQASCEDRAMMMFEECMATGQDPDMCHMQLNEMLESCYASCNGEPVPPEPSDCQTECEYMARMQLEECLNSGVDPNRCEMQYMETLDACVAGCTVQPPPPTDCTAGCEEKARMEFESCLASGGAPERCDAVYQQTLEDCMQSCEVVVTPVPVNQECLAACDERAMMLYDTCIQDNGDPAECKMLYQDAYESCAMSCG